MTMVTATPPAGIANAGTSDNRNVLLSVRDVQKVYGSREAITRALDDVSFDICEGEFVGVMGPSGSGKSTLLNCISTIDAVTSGSIILNGRDITQLRSRQLVQVPPRRPGLHLPGRQPAGHPDRFREHRPGPYHQGREGRCRPREGR